jgi:hypothetical protein
MSQKNFKHFSTFVFIAVHFSEKGKEMWLKPNAF